MPKRPVLVSALFTVLIGLVPALALASTPDGYRVISYRHADGGFSSVEGCVLTQVFLGSTDAKYGSTQGPVNKQAGPTDVLFIQSDLCGEPIGKGYPPIHVWQGQAMIGLQSNAQFSVGWVQGSMPVSDDVTGTTATATFDLRWDSTGRATRAPSHQHVRFPGIAVVNSRDNDTMVDAVMSGSLTIDGSTTTVWSSDARLSTVKAGCSVIVHPGADASDISCV